MVILAKMGPQDLVIVSSTMIGLILSNLRSVSGTGRDTDSTGTILLAGKTGRQTNRRASL